MKKNDVRGVSIHSTGEGLAYYIHYDKLGTQSVDKKTYEEAISSLEKWKTLIDKKKKEATAIKL